LKIVLLIVALLLLAIIPSAYCLGEGTPYIPTDEGTYYRVDVINETIWNEWGFKPEHFWNLTNADQDILRAIENVGIFIKTNLTEPLPGTFLGEYYNHNCNPYFTYNGSYYSLYPSCVVWIAYEGSLNSGVSGLYYSVILVENPENPEDYVELTNPDPYTLAAIKHLGIGILFDSYYLNDHPDEQSIKDAKSAAVLISKFKYQDKYYQVSGVTDITSKETPPLDWSKEIAAGAGVTAVGIAATVFIVHRKRKNHLAQKQ